MFKRILIANRGEIAVRVFRACREMDIEPVVVYSQADSEALHVQLAERAYCIGPARSADSYLNVDAILTGKQTQYTSSVVRLVEQQAQEFVNDLFSTLRERMLDLRYCTVVFVGGGAILLRRQIEASGKVGKPLFVSNINANAAGYEYLYRLEAAGR